MRARYYDPATGRFNQEDTHWNPDNMIYGDNPQKINEKEDSSGRRTHTLVPDKTAINQSGNRYAYSMNSPVAFVDPTGEIGTPISWALAVIAGIAGAFLGNYLADQYGIEGWKRVALIAGVAAGGAILGFIAGELLAGFTKAFLLANPSIMAKLPAAVLWLFGVPDFGNLSRAAEFGLNTYYQMRQLIQGTGLQAHHIIEQRFGLSINISVAVTPAEHQIFTNAWRALVPYGSDYAVLTLEQIWNFAQQVYQNYPAILEAIRQALGF